MSLPTLLGHSNAATLANKQVALRPGDVKVMQRSRQHWEGNAAQPATCADLDGEYLQEIHRQLLSASLRLQNHYTCLPQQIASVASEPMFASTSGSDADLESPVFFDLESPVSKDGDNSDVVWPAPQVAQNSTMEQSTCMRDVWRQEIDGHLWIHWRVHSHKLRSKDKSIVSPSFELLPGVSFKLMILALSSGERKGQGCFTKSRGFGTVSLKLGSPLEDPTSSPKIAFRLSIGSGHQRQALRGPVEHDFDCSVCGLPKGIDEWDFRSAVDADSSTVTVSLEVLPDSI